MHPFHSWEYRVFGGALFAAMHAHSSQFTVRESIRNRIPPPTATSSAEEKRRYNHRGRPPRYLAVLSSSTPSFNNSTQPATSCWPPGRVQSVRALAVAQLSFNLKRPQTSTTPCLDHQAG